MELHGRYERSLYSWLQMSVLSNFTLMFSYGSIISLTKIFESDTFD